jgi:hypothetical protein
LGQYKDVPFRALFFNFAYNPNVTNKVTVSKNGTSAAYSDGVSSTINMSTNDKVGTTISGGGGVNLISADAFVEIPLAENLELDISASLYYRRNQYTHI